MSPRTCNLWSPDLGPGGLQARRVKRRRRSMFRPPLAGRVTAPAPFPEYMTAALWFSRISLWVYFYRRVLQRRKVALSLPRSRPAAVGRTLWASGTPLWDHLPGWTYPELLPPPALQLEISTNHYLTILLHFLLFRLQILLLSSYRLVCRFLSLHLGVRRWPCSIVCRPIWPVSTTLLTMC